MLPEKNCIICGKTFIPRRRTQVTCASKKCQNQRYYQQYEKSPYVYKYSKNEGLETPKKKPVKKNPKKMSAKKWNALPVAERWELMTWDQISAECLRLHISYGKAQTFLMQGRLPEDFGKRMEENNG